MEGNSTPHHSFTKNSTNSDMHIAASPQGRKFLVAALVLITLAIIVGNSLVLAVLRKQRNIISQRVVSVFLSNLAVMDLSIALLIIPISMTTVIEGKWALGEVMCHINGFVTMVVGIVAILTMTAIAVDRYRIIVLPANQRLQPNHAIRILIFIWLGAILLALPPVVGWNKYAWGPSSSVCRATLGQKDGYIELVAFLSYIVPLGIMVFCYVRVYITVRQSRRRIEMWAKFTQDVWLRAETHTAKVVFTVLSVFIICWTPFVVVYAINGTVSVPKEVFMLTSFMASMHSACNPIIYLTMNKRFRRDLLLLLCSKRTRARSDATMRPSNIPQIIRAMHVAVEQQIANHNAAANVIDSDKPVPAPKNESSKC